MMTDQHIAEAAQNLADVNDGEALKAHAAMVGGLLAEHFGATVATMILDNIARAIDSRRIHAANDGGLAFGAKTTRPYGGRGVRVPKAVRDAILAEVAPKYQITPAHILSKRIFRPYAHARHEAMWRLRDIKAADGRPKHSLPAIAEAMGVHDHSTVIHGIRRHQARLAAHQLEVASHG